MNNSYLWKFFIIYAVVQSLVGCTRNAEKNSDTFTLETGVALQEVKACDVQQKIQEQTSSVRKLSDGYEIAVSASFACDTKIIKPYLTATNHKKATLVIASLASKEVLNSSCECARSLVIKLSNRLEVGDTLYLLREQEVLGHLVMP